MPELDSFLLPLQARITVRFVSQETGKPFYSFLNKLLCISQDHTGKAVLEFERGAISIEEPFQDAVSRIAKICNPTTVDKQVHTT
jgi:hypothetical protein